MNPASLKQELRDELGRRNHPIAKTLNQNRRFILNTGYEEAKLHIAKAYGCFIEDFSGNVYIDTALGAGTHILGHANPIIAEELARQAKNGTLYILPNKHTYEVGGLLSRTIPHFDSFVFCNSGSEATIRLVRIARAYTGKKKIAMFSGGWHGGNDMLLFEDDYSSDTEQPLPVFKSGGLPQEIMDMTLMLPYNSNAAFDLIEHHKNELAMVIIEPSQGSNPRDDVGTFLNKLRKVTSKYDILLCFDEIITGFRIALGGCQEYCGIEADMVAYGKTLGAGVSIGMVAGTNKVMKVVNGNGQEKPVFMGGTFSANPLAMCISKTVLKHLTENRQNIYPMLNENGKYLRDTINQFCIDNEIPVRMMGIGSMSRMIFTEIPIKSRRDRDKYELDDNLQKLFYSYLRLKKGVHISDNRIIFLSTAHKKEHIEKIIRSIIESLEYFARHLELFN
jgi:glutamate-1-semialdehyde 2,1-aminomutase